MQNDRGGRVLSAGWVAAIAASFLQFMGYQRLLYAPPTRDMIRREKARGGAYLHPTKGWRGPGTVSGGTNRRRVRVK